MPVGVNQMTLSPEQLAETSVEGADRWLSANRNLVRLQRGARLPLQGAIRPTEQPRHSVRAGEQDLWRARPPRRRTCHTQPMLYMPMPLVRVPEPFDHPDWLYELKHDGFRALAH